VFATRTPTASAEQQYQALQQQLPPNAAHLILRAVTVHLHRAAFGEQWPRWLSIPLTHQHNAMRRWEDTFDSQRSEDVELVGHNCLNQVEDTIRALQDEIIRMGGQLDAELPPESSAAASSRGRWNGEGELEPRPITDLAVLYHQLHLAIRQSQHAVFEIEADSRMFGRSDAVMHAQHVARCWLRHLEQQHTTALAELQAGIARQQQQASLLQQITVVLLGPYRDWFQEYARAPNMWRIAHGDELALTEISWGTIPERVGSAKAQRRLMRRGLGYALKHTNPTHVTAAHLRQAQCRWVAAAEREHTLSHYARGGTWQEHLAWRDALQEHKRACQHLHNVVHTRTLQAAGRLNTAPEERQAHAVFRRQQEQQAACQLRSHHCPIVYARWKDQWPAAPTLGWQPLM
jgi:hypothetical protein